MARTGGYRRSAVWRPCGVTPHAALQNKNVVCSGSRVIISTVMKLRWSVKQGGINIETYTKSTCSHKYWTTLHTQWDVAAGVEDFYFREQMQTVIKHRFYPYLCRFLMKIIPVIKWVCACVKTSVSNGGLGICQPNDFYLHWEILRFGLTQRKHYCR